ncbi:hypothetical protein FRIGORI9N_370021 [Frigoribacterium sp. 9N]|nr:hypothetical protein FRIGORI9N_370021 [Frigoribacterium sp. 9N]
MPGSTDEHHAPLHRGLTPRRLRCAERRVALHELGRRVGAHPRGRTDLAERRGQGPPLVRGLAVGHRRRDDHPRMGPSGQGRVPRQGLADGRGPGRDRRAQPHGRLLRHDDRVRRRGPRSAGAEGPDGPAAALAQQRSAAATGLVGRGSHDGSRLAQLSRAS